MKEGSLRAMSFQAAPIAKPLGSVKKICQAGHIVVLDDEGSYIYNNETQELNWMREHNGNYMLDVWLPPAAAMDQQSRQQSQYANDLGGWPQRPFGRQP